MIKYNTECPCCGKDITVNVKDNGEISVVFFSEPISEEEAFEEYGICLATKGGEHSG